MTTTTVTRIADLYPVVQDLTDVEYGGDRDDYCGNFQLRDLAVPLSEPLNIYRQSERTPPPLVKQHHRRGSSFLRLLRASHDDTSEVTVSTSTGCVTGTTLLEATRFKDKYVLVRQISSTGSTTFSEYINVSCGKRFLVKAIDCSISAAAEINARQESVYLKLLQHCAHVIEMHEVVEEDDQMYIVLEYCPNTSLVSKLREFDICNEASTKRFMYSLLLGLYQIHALNISHNALCPDNVVSNESNDMKITNLSNACRFGSQCNDIDATSPYTAPELGIGMPCSATSDMWSVGVLLYYCLFGKTPIIGKSRRTLRNKIILPKTDWRMVSKSVKRLILGCLRIEPKLRITLDQAINHVWFCGGGYRSECRSRRTRSELPVLSHLRLTRTGSSETYSTVTSTEPPLTP